MTMKCEKCGCWLTWLTGHHMVYDGQGQPMAVCRRCRSYIENGHDGE